MSYDGKVWLCVHQFISRIFDYIIGRISEYILRRPKMTNI